MTLCVVTGASSGIGLETARVLAGHGWDLLMVSRDVARGEAARHVVAEAGEGRVEFIPADLSSLAAVRELAATILERAPRIDVLMSNAGVFNARHRVTTDGVEKTFAVNHLAPFLLTNLLRDRLAESGDARIVVVASGAHYGVTMPADPTAGRPRGWLAYQRSKLANVMFTYALARRLASTNVTANCLHPGFVRTRLGSGNGVPIRLVYGLLYPWTIPVREGAVTPVYLARSPEVEGLSGLYFDRCRAVRSSRPSYDEGAQERLWDFSARLTGIG